MKIRWVIVALLVMLGVFLVNDRSDAVSTREIDQVLAKQVLSAQDLEVIDRFVGEAVAELVKTRDFTEVAKLRALIVSKRGQQAQYAQQFLESAHKHISLGLQKALTLPEDRKVKVTVNLLILIDQLHDVRLADLSIGLLKSNNMMVRYWAVHSLTNAVIVNQLNAQGEAGMRLARLIAGQLKDIVASSSAEVLGLIARFGGAVDVGQGEELLLAIADERIKRYASWNVRYELLESVVLKLLSDKIVSGGGNKAALAQHFGQLYSCVIQRYIKGQERLNDTQKHHLASVIVEVENSCLGSLLGVPQTTMKRAVERGDLTLLWQEHVRILGDSSAAGQLSSKLQFTYGKDARGNDRLGPFLLPEPPAPQASPVSSTGA